MFTPLIPPTGVTAKVLAYAGPSGSVVVNTSTNTLHVQDGVTSGGFALSKVGHTHASNEVASWLGYTPACLGSDGKLLVSQLPKIAITDTFVVPDQVSMLALTAETGDVAIRTDLPATFILKGADPTNLSGWQELPNPASGVSSVNGQTGPAITLGTGDISESGTNKYYTDARTRAAISVTVGSSGVTYNPTTGVIDMSALSATVTSTTLGSGTASASTYLRGDRTWASLPVAAVLALSTVLGDGSAAATLSAARGGTRVASTLYLSGGQSPSGSVNGGDIILTPGTNTTAGSGIGNVVIQGSPSGSYAGASGGQGNGAIQFLTGAAQTTNGTNALINRLTIQSGGAWTLNGDAGMAGYVITSAGAGAPPTWSAVSVLASNIGGVIPTSNIGSGTASASTYLAGDGTWKVYSAGTGTVTTLSVITANGVSGSVANNTSTPAITLTLGAITPTSVAATGAVSGATLAGAGSAITALNASNLASGTVPTARLGSGTASATTVLYGDGTWKTANVGTVTAVTVTTANGISGSSSGGATPVLTITLGDITPSSVTASGTVLANRMMVGNGTAAAPSISFTADIQSDTGFNHVNDGEIQFITDSVNIAQMTGTKFTFSGSTGLAGVGTLLTALNASNLASGTVGTARLGTGTASATTVLYGDGTWKTLPATLSLTAGASGATYSSSTGVLDLSALVADTTLPATQILYGNGSNVSTNSSNFTFVNGSTTLQLGTTVGGSATIKTVNAGGTGQGVANLTVAAGDSTDYYFTGPGSLTLQAGSALTGSGNSGTAGGNVAITAGSSAATLGGSNGGTVSITAGTSANATHGMVQVATGGVLRLSVLGSGAISLGSSTIATGTVGQVITSAGNGAPPTWTSIVTGGTVTTVSVVSANGVSGSVATNSTTPAITLTLGAITPTSVAASGAVSGSTLAGAGSAITALNASNLASGTVPTARLGSGTASATTALYGDGTWKTVPAGYTDAQARAAISLTAGGSGVTYNNTTGVLDLSALTATSGTVTAVSVATANGVSAISSGGATPALTVTLGAITPTSVNTSGVVTSARLSVGNGTPSAPSIAFTADLQSDTGFNHVNDGEIQFITDSVNAAQLTITGFAHGGSSGFTGIGTNLTALNASNLGSGTVSTARLGTGTASATTVLYGDGSWKALSAATSLQATGLAAVSTSTTGSYIGRDGNNQPILGLVHSGAGADAKYSEWNLNSAGTLQLTFLNDANGSSTNPISITRTGINATLMTLGAASINLTGLTAGLQVNGAAGTVGQVFTSNGAAAPPTWQTPSAGGTSTPGGADTQIQYNSAGIFAGTSSFTFSSATGIVTATGFSGAHTGNGSALIALNASNLASGIVGTARLGSGTASSTTILYGDGTWKTAPTGGTSAPGGATTQVQYNNAGALAGDVGMTYASASGTLTTTQYVGGGVGLTNLNASNLASGTVSTARLGSGAASGTTFLAGDGTWKTPSATASATLTTGYVAYGIAGAMSGTSGFTFAPATSGTTFNTLTLANDSAPGRQVLIQTATATGGNTGQNAPNIYITAGNGLANVATSGALILTSGSATGTADGYVSVNTSTVGGAVTERLRILGTGAWTFGGATNVGSAGALMTSTGATSNPTWNPVLTMTGSATNNAGVPLMVLGISTNSQGAVIQQNDTPVQGFLIRGGDNSTSTTATFGGSLTLKAGSPASGAGGNVFIQAGGGNGINGYIKLQTYTGSAYVDRLTIDSSGTWFVNGQAGTAGGILTSAGTGAPPTWTSTPVLGGLTVNGTSANASPSVTGIKLGADTVGSAMMQLYSSGGGTDQKVARIYQGTSAFTADFVNDAYTGSTAFMNVTRSGTTAAIMALTATSITLNGTVTLNNPLVGGILAVNTFLNVSSFNSGNTSGVAIGRSGGDSSAQIQMYDSGATTGFRGFRMMNWQNALRMQFMADDGVSSGAEFLNATRTTANSGAATILLTAVTSVTMTTPTVSMSGALTVSGSATAGSHIATGGQGMFTSNGTVTLAAVGNNSVQITTPAVASGNAGPIVLTAGNASSGNGGNVTITASNGSTGAGTITLNTGTGNGSSTSSGGAFTLNMGANAGGPGAPMNFNGSNGSTIGGSVTITSGSGSGGTGGDISLNTGTGSTTRGNVNINALSLVSNNNITTPLHTSTATVTLQSAPGNNQVNVLSPATTTVGTGAIVIGSGNGTTSGNTGLLQMSTGNATSGNSGAFTVTTGSATGTTGNISLTVGTSSAGAAGSATLGAGNSNTTSAGGNLILSAGNSGGAAGGNVTVTSGSGTSANGGNISITAGAGTLQGVVNISGSAINLTGNVSGGTINSRVNPRSVAVTSGTTITVNSDTTDYESITAMAAAFTIANPTGTPVGGQNLTLQISDNGTARAITWGAIFNGFGTILPTTTTASKAMYVFCMWNTISSKWDAFQIVQS